MARRFVVADGALLMAIGVYCGCVVLLGYLYGISDQVNLNLYNDTAGISVFVLCAIYVCDRILRTWWNRPNAWPLFAVKRFRAALPFVIAMPAFMSAYNSGKSLLPTIYPYRWDSTFARWDEWIHGVQPWRLLYPILGNSTGAHAMDFIYMLWFPVFLGTFCWQLFSLSRPELRRQFFATYFLTWILLGTVLTIMFSSAGPCFYERVTGQSSSYDELMTHLRQYPLRSTAAQDYLWKLYRANQTSVLGGISAMPSMHASMAVLCALVVWRANRLAGITLAVFAVLVGIACVYLGWHYAVDVYLAAVGTVATWWAVGFFGQGRSPGSGGALTCEVQRDLDPSEPAGRLFPFVLLGTLSPQAPGI